MYGIKKNNGYVFLFTSLEDIGTTTSLIKSQLIYLTLLTILLSIVIAMFLSRRIAKPISDMTKKATKLADGNYNLVFKNTGINELDELANSLNYLEQEVSKTDTYRRDLMANVSHDLKTPLTMIKAYAEMIKDITIDDKEKTIKNLDVIIEETERLNILVNDILELSKLQNNHDNLDIEEFDIVLLIKDILRRYEIIKETENYNLILESPESIIVKADKKRISQVIYNLINNAVNYTGDDLKVIVRLTEESKDCLVEIIDTGKGIDEEDLQNIWNRYYKQEKNHKRNVIGTGLGLSIVKNILEQHHFDYGVKSIKNHGTTFYFKIKNSSWEKYHNSDRFVDIDGSEEGVFTLLYENQDFFLGYIADKKKKGNYMQPFLYDKMKDKTYLLRWCDYYEHLKELDYFEGYEARGIFEDYFIAHVSFSTLDQYNIFERVKDGALKITNPELERVIQNLNTDSNPVLILTKFKHL